MEEKELVSLLEGKLDQVNHGIIPSFAGQSLAAVEFTRKIYGDAYKDGYRAAIKEILRELGQIQYIGQ